MRALSEGFGDNGTSCRDVTPVASEAFYLDSYLGLAKRENTLQSGSFISAIVEAKIEENRELQGERIFHQLIATYGVPIINDDNNNPSN